ncbi:hypothetical protein D3C71_1353170 [compost metagenome]
MAQDVDGIYILAAVECVGHEAHTVDTRLDEVDLGPRRQGLRQHIRLVNGAVNEIDLVALFHRFGRGRLVLLDGAQGGDQFGMRLGIRCGRRVGDGLRHLLRRLGHGGVQQDAGFKGLEEEARAQRARAEGLRGLLAETRSGFVFHCTPLTEIAWTLPVATSPHSCNAPSARRSCFFVLMRRPRATARLLYAAPGGWPS